MLLKSIICETKNPMWTKFFVKTSFCAIEENKIRLHFQMLPRKKTFKSRMYLVNHDFISQRQCPGRDPKLTLQQRSREQGPGLHSAVQFPQSRAPSHQISTLLWNVGAWSKAAILGHLKPYCVATLPSCFLVIPALFSQATYLGPRDVLGSFSHHKSVEGLLYNSFSLFKSSCADTETHLAREKRIIKGQNFNFTVLSQL